MLVLHLMMSKHDGRGSMLCLRWNNGHIRSVVGGCLAVCLIWNTQTNKKKFGGKNNIICDESTNINTHIKWHILMVITWWLLCWWKVVSRFLPGRNDLPCHLQIKKQTETRKHKEKTKLHASPSTFRKMDKNQIWQHWKSSKPQKVKAKIC